MKRNKRNDERITDNERIGYHVEKYNSCQVDSKK